MTSPTLDTTFSFEPQGLYLIILLCIFWPKVFQLTLSSRYDRFSSDYKCIRV